MTVTRPLRTLATTGLMRPNRTHFANPKVRRLAPPGPHPLPSRGHPRTERTPDAS